MPTWLARMRQPARSGRRRRATARPPRSPYQLSSSTVPSGASRSSDSCSPAAVALACTTRSRPAGGVAPARANGDAERVRPPPPGRRRRRRGSTSAPGKPGQQPGDAAADHAGADHGDPVADQRSGVPQRVDGGLHGAGEHRAPGRDVVGHRHDGRRGHDVGGLVRVEAEDGAAEQVGGPVLDHADVEVAVLHRPGEVALLERGAHRPRAGSPAPRRGRPAPPCRG